MVQILAITGLQWGDEGKGKIVDLLSKKVQHVVRAQGGHNAGHTVLVGNDEFTFHLIPSGILYPKVKCYIGGGVVLEPGALLTEIATLASHKIPYEGRLFISRYAHLIFPYHIALDRAQEEEKGELAIGTTGRGIGPCYSDIVNRIGIRVGDLMDLDAFKEKLKSVLLLKNRELERYRLPKIDFDELMQTFLEYRQKLSPFVAPVEEMLFACRGKNEKILLEGAQGALLDVVYGTYPYVTSSHTLAGGLCIGSGIGPSSIDQTLGVIKAYSTRVGNGPFPTQFSQNEEKNFLNHTSAREIGATTGRKRRMGWFDAVLARFSISINGVDQLALTKLDVLDTLSEIKICIGYQKGNQKFSHPPLNLEGVVPLYESVKGWNASTQEITDFESLPTLAKKYVNRLEELCGVPISLLSYGPKREQTLNVRPVF